MRTEEIELDLLLQAIYEKHGYDFRDYSRASLLRRVRHAVREEGVRTLSGLQEVILHNDGAIERFIAAFSVNVSAMFRDPEFYTVLREQVAPMLRTYPSIRIWHAGCASGEEVLSMAILLKELQLYDRSTIYGTDISERLLRNARQGKFPIGQMKANTQNYQLAGGTHDFSTYYTTDSTWATFRPELMKNVYFSEHNLVSDAPFNEFHLVLCRNVMIYFNKALRERVLQLLHKSLARFGVLGLGIKESLAFSDLAQHYGEIVPASRVYRRNG